MADLAQHYRVTRAIGAAMIASLLIDAGVVEIIRARFAPFEGFTRFSQWEVLRRPLRRRRQRGGLLLLPRPLAAALRVPLPALGPVAGVGAAIRALTERPCPS